MIPQIEKIRNNIPNDVRLIAVSKTMPSETIRMAYDGGIRDFAENKLQEALEKQEQLKDLDDICWHFIGHLQSNKAKKAVESFPWIHSIDSLKIAQRINRLAQEAFSQQTIKNLPQVCLQVKILPDESKYGWNVEQLWQDVEAIKQLDSLRLRGLMAILPLGLSKDETLQAFKDVKSLADELKPHFGSDFDQLSMGMSGDYPLAIEAGATMIRLGTILFGKRSTVALR
ncbi:YggS family pyridoxal phosphate-dependent enzyme [Cyanobacterium stanieri LEGE 03274]|uniref:Pyridoxal phosphate homeostasis protein n=1 Tax=Cyanobacterium stanieri LEGE 03274 TaxID=1828756 RepID=A0ABR9V3G6_9CHRO|nr:YggS family pyridoxal phosphate-dependent enzyme [Cyanobacterium stanieri]MBE9221344.1 YggS family pyridoxal phosphate-dependent enzyme [Cyanobacterium stanieri LEGE 03274]